MKKVLITLMILGSTLAIANESCKGERGGDRQPPQDAIDICEGKATDTACKMKSPFGDIIDGTCQYTPDEKYFACKPEQGPRKDR